MRITRNSFFIHQEIRDPLVHPTDLPYSDEEEDNDDAEFLPLSGATDPAASTQGEEDESAFMDSASSVASSASSALPMRQLKADFPELIRGAAALKGIPLPMPPPCPEPDGMVSDYYCQWPSSKKPLLCPRFPPIDPYIDAAHNDHSGIKSPVCTHLPYRQVEGRGKPQVTGILRLESTLAALLCPDVVRQEAAAKTVAPQACFCPG